MQTKRLTGAGLVAVALGLGALAAGCGGSSTNATPLGNPVAVTTPTTLGGSAPATLPRPGHITGPTSGGPRSTPTASAGRGAHSATGTQPAPAQLSAASQDLGLAGSALADGNTAISGSNVNQAKAQEGSAP